MPARSFALVPALLLLQSCAARQTPPETKPSGAHCVKHDATVSAGLAERLAATGDVLSFESAWRSERPGKVAGTISRPNVTQVIRNQGADIKSCYDASFDKLPDDSRGRVVVRFVVDGAGHVPAATIASNELGVPEVACCLAERVTQWAFVPPTTGDFVIIEYPFSVRVQK
jgi:hypothetical protein